MTHTEHVEELVCLIASLDRPTLVHHLLEFHASFPIDFSVEFLEQQSTERLRHLLFALCIQSQNLPDISEPTAA